MSKHVKVVDDECGKSKGGQRGTASAIFDKSASKSLPSGSRFEWHSGHLDKVQNRLLGGEHHKQREEEGQSP